MAVWAGGFVLRTNLAPHLKGEMGGRRLCIFEYVNILLCKILYDDSKPIYSKL